MRTLIGPDSAPAQHSYVVDFLSRTIRRIAALASDANPGQAALTFDRSGSESGESAPERAPSSAAKPCFCAADATFSIPRRAIMEKDETNRRFRLLPRCYRRGPGVA
jgi:hypothetical protein